MAGDRKRDEIWSRVVELIDRAPTPEDLHNHRLDLPAAQQFRATNRRVPALFAAEERRAALGLIAVPVVLQRLVDAYDDRIVLIKGPDVARYYPDPGLRSFDDLDVLVADAEAAQRALLDAGFDPVGDPAIFVDIHHLRPLAMGDLPLPVELHSEPKWLEGMPAPVARELLDAAESAPTSVRGISVLPPEHHALVLAVHSWAHEPLRRLRDLVDVALVRAQADEREIERIARNWRIDRLWRTTAEVIDALFADCQPPLALRTWARNLVLVQERTVFESHLEHLLSPFFAHSLPTAVKRLPRALLAEVGRSPDETWSAKVARTRVAFRNARHRRSQHERDVGDKADRD